MSGGNYLQPIDNGNLNIAYQYVYAASVFFDKIKCLLSVICFSYNLVIFMEGFDRCKYIS